MTPPNPRHARNAGQETIPPQNEVSGGPETPQGGASATR
jgi:hypothetical protein